MLDNVPVHAPAPGTIMMLDTKKKSLLGMSGDMRFKAHYEVDSTNNLHFTEIATNQQSTNPFESAILNALAQTQTWRIVDHKLNLINQKGVVMASLVVAGK